MKLEEAKQKYQGEWIAFRSLDQSVNPEGDVICHNADRQIFEQELIKKKVVDVYITFAGSLPEKAFMF